MTMPGNEHDFDLLAPLKNGTAAYSDGRGAELTGPDGRKYTDLNEMRIVLGQHNAAFDAAVKEALGGVTKGASAYKERLFSHFIRSTGGAFEAAFLASSGSEAVESAVRIARAATGRTEIFSFWNSIHGRTYLSSSLSGLPKRKTHQGFIEPGVVLLPYAASLKDTFSDPEQCAAESLKLAGRIYEYGSCHDGAAVIVEPYQGADVSVPPRGWLKEVQNWAHERGMLFIVDEVQTGMGRSGEMYMYQREGVEPDMLLLGKALGNGFHIAALLVRRRPPEEVLPMLSGGSGDAPLACAAACCVYDQLQNGLLEHAAAVGRKLQDGLRQIRSPLVRETRGVGLAGAVEFFSGERCAETVHALFERGFLTGRTKNSLFVKPPYVVTEEQTGAFLENLEDILKKSGARK